MKRYPKGAAAVQALESGKLDCVVIDAQPAKKFVEKNDNLKIIDGIFDDEQYAICVKKGNSKLLKEMNAALEELKKDGTVDKIIGNYIGDDAGKYQYKTPEGTDTSKGTLVMATNAEFEPYEYHEGDAIVGIDVDMSQAICDKIGYKLKVEDMEFDSILPAVAAGKADFGAAGMTVTDERKETVDFTNSYYEAVQYVILPADSEIATADDLKDKAIGVQLGTTGDFIAEELTSNVSQYNKAVDAVNDLVNGRVDLVIIDKNPALVFENKFEGQVVAVDGAQFGFEPEEYAIALPKGDTALADQINAAIDELKADGTFDELVKTYIEAE